MSGKGAGPIVIDRTVGRLFLCPREEKTAAASKAQGGVCLVCGFSVVDAGAVLGYLHLPRLSMWVPAVLHERCYDAVAEEGSLAAAWDRMERGLKDGGRWRWDEARAAMVTFVNSLNETDRFI